MNVLDSEKILYPCNDCGNDSDHCLTYHKCGKWRKWMSQKWKELVDPLKTKNNPELKTITYKEKLHSILNNAKCPIAFENIETEKKMVNWLLSCGVLISPCKVGDILWFLNEENVVTFDVVEKIQFIHSEYEIPKSSASGWIVFGGKSRFHDWEFGSNVFLNKKEADRLAGRLSKGESK